MANNGWMQEPVGYAVENGAFVPVDWFKIIFSPVLWVRFPHMPLASFVTGAFCVAATGAWPAARHRRRRGANHADYQPVKFAAIEGRWHDEQPAGEVLLALPDPAAETNRYEIKIPILGSLIGSMSLNTKEVGLTDFPPQHRPPVTIPFFAFRIMVGCGLVMLLLD